MASVYILSYLSFISQAASKRQKDESQNNKVPVLSAITDGPPDGGVGVTTWSSLRVSVEYTCTRRMEEKTCLQWSA